MKYLLLISVILVSMFITSCQDKDYFFGAGGSSVDYGEIYNAASLGTTISGSGWNQVTNFDTNGVSSGATPDHTNDHITISTNGTYSITTYGSIKTGSSSQTTAFISVYKNNQATRIQDMRQDGIAPFNDGVRPFSLSALATLTSGDTIELWVYSSTAAGTTFNKQHLNVVQIS